MSGGRGDIIIKRGSVAIELNESTYTGKNGKYSNQHRKIASVEVTDDTGDAQTINVTAGWKCTIKSIPVERKAEPAIYESFNSRSSTSNKRIQAVKQVCYESVMFP